MRKLAIAAAVLLLAATPALARERCDKPDTQPGLKIEFHVGFGKVNDPQMDEQIYQMELKRRHGIEARTVTVTGDGCLEAFVQNPDGTWRNEYYDPKTYRRMN